MCVYGHMYMCAVKATGSENLMVVVVIDVNKNSLRTYFPILLKPSRTDQVGRCPGAEERKGPRKANGPTRLTL